MCAGNSLKSGMDGEELGVCPSGLKWGPYLVSRQQHATTLSVKRIRSRHCNRIYSAVFASCWKVSVLVLVSCLNGMFAFRSRL